MSATGGSALYDTGDNDDDDDDTTPLTKPPPAKAPAKPAAKAAAPARPKPKGMDLYDTGEDYEAKPATTAQSLMQAIAMFGGDDDDGDSDEDGLPAKAGRRESEFAESESQRMEMAAMEYLPVDGPVSEEHVGSRVIVDKFGEGVLRFFGPHHRDGKNRCGVELFTPTGINNGTIGVGYSLLFDCWA